jgi:hypothetical protein
VQQGVNKSSSADLLFLTGELGLLGKKDVGFGRDNDNAAASVFGKTLGFGR